MKRRLFFFLEKLEIKRSERIAVSVLMIILVLLSGIRLIQKPSTNYDEKQYQEMEQVFKEKSKKIQEERDLILARYEPNRQVPVSSSVMEEQDVAVSEADTTDQDQPVELVNINMATREQLQVLPGIGPAYAGRIVEWRKENGSFTAKDQLIEIKGIGEKRLEKIKPLITL